MSLFRRAAARCRFEAHWRCSEPVVVIESDDWGLKRSPCWDLVSRFGEPTEWALEQTEDADDLEKLAEVLSTYRDEAGRPACLTANFIMSNPDHAAMRALQYEAYVDLPLTSSLPPATISGYHSAIGRQCFYPQYHGLRHLNEGRLLTDLRGSSPGARELFEQGCTAGLSLIKGSIWRYHSEYTDWASGRADEAGISRTVAAGTALFAELFRFQPRTTIAPHYVLSQPGFRAWAAAGIEYVQGCNYQIYSGTAGATRIASAWLGQVGPAGLTLMTRNVKLEPRPGRRETADAAIDAARRLMHARVPVVVDTHRINYTGRFRDASLAALRQLLEALAPMRPRFLTTQELGDAIRNGGAYRDAFNGTGRVLNPIERGLSNVWRGVARSLEATR